MAVLGLTQYVLELMDGSSWAISAGDEKTVPVVSHFAETMQLSFSEKQVLLGSGVSQNFLLAILGGEQSSTFLPLRKSSNGDSQIICPLNHWESENERFAHFIKLSLILARQSQMLGGVLLHGALASWEGCGVVFSGAGGAGKTTASNRLPSPWKSLSDDLTLAVRDSHGDYWAHPWPTWSRFLSGESGGSWDVQKAVSLKSIFFITKSEKDQIDSIGRGLAVNLLLNSVQQASSLMIRDLEQKETRCLHFEWLNNICDLSRCISVHTLGISFKGTFWRLVERTLRKNYNRYRYPHK
jgi:SynChlorMet cassette protein ScmC